MTFSFSANGQTWEWAVDGENITSTRIVALDGDIYVTGSFTNSCRIKDLTLSATSPQSSFLIKMDGYSNVIWHRIFNANEVSINCLESQNSGIYIVGSFSGILTSSSVSLTSQGGKDLFIIKFAKNGNIDWTISDGSPANEELVAMDVDSFLVITGQFSAGASISGQSLSSTCNDDNNVFIAKYALNGQNAWVKEISGDSTNTARVYDVLVDRSDASILIQGDFQSMSNQFKFSDSITTSCWGCRGIYRFANNGSYRGYVTSTQNNASPWENNTTVGIDEAGNVYSALTLKSNISSESSGFVKYRDDGTKVLSEILASNFSIPQKINIHQQNLVVGGYYNGEIIFPIDNNSASNVASVNGSGIYIILFDSSANNRRVYTAELPKVNFGAADVSGLTFGDMQSIYLTGSFTTNLKFNNTLLTANNNKAIYIAKLSDLTTTGLRYDRLTEGTLLTVSPNPGERFFTVSFKERMGRNTLKVINVLGSVLYSETLDINSSDYQKTLDLLSLTKGVYFVIVEGGESRESRRIIIQ